MLIMEIRSLVCLSPTRTCRPLADWRSSAIAFAAVSGQRCWATRTTGVSDVSQLVKNFTPVKLMAAAGAYSCAHKRATLVTADDEQQS